MLMICDSSAYYGSRVWQFLFIRDFCVGDDSSGRQTVGGTVGTKITECRESRAGKLWELFPLSSGNFKSSPHERFSLKIFFSCWIKFEEKFIFLNPKVAHVLQIWTDPVQNCRGLEMGDGQATGEMPGLLTNWNRPQPAPRAQARLSRRNHTLRGVIRQWKRRFCVYCVVQRALLSCSLARSFKVKLDQR